MRSRVEVSRIAHKETSRFLAPASLTFKLPDNLTTWRIMVTAVGEDNRFGYADQTITVTQPFLLRPIFPRFARLDDRFQAGVAVNKLTDMSGKVRVTAEISGSSLSLPDSALNAQITIEPGATEAVLFPFTADASGNSEITFSAHFDGLSGKKDFKASDARQHIVRGSEFDGNRDRGSRE